MPALAVHHTATEDSPWDGPAAVAAMPNDDAVLRYCHAWQTPAAADADHQSNDDDVDDQKGSYKFPHHRTKGGPANVAACRNGLARLSNAGIPDADQTGVKAHLQAHLDDAEKKTSDQVLPAAAVPWSAPGELAVYGRMTGAERVKAHLPRVQRLSNRTDWYRITDTTDGVTPARLDVYDEIGFFGISAGDFNAQLQAITAPSITVHINSPGGDVFDGIAILNMLRAHPAPVTTVVDGLAASAASFIAMAGDTVEVMPNGQFMVHDASGVCMGNPADMVEMADLLDKVSDNIAAIYARRAGGTVDQWRTAMKAETWYSDSEAVTAGLADRVVALPDKTSQQPANHWNLSFYAYSGRAEAPPPAPPSPVPPTETPATSGGFAVSGPFQLDLELLRNAMKEAAQ